MVASDIGIYDTDVDGVWDPAEVLAKIADSAENIDLADFQQGSGLVNAQVATN